MNERRTDYELRASLAMFIDALRVAARILPSAIVAAEIRRARLALEDLILIQQETPREDHHDRGR